MPLQGSLSIERMCELTRVSRASFYRSFQEQRPIEEEMEVRSAIQQKSCRCAQKFVSLWESCAQTVPKIISMLHRPR
jgi:hypothetical protein